MPFEKDPNEIGALWVKSSARGEFMSGTINGVNVVCFPIEKRNEKSPSWRVLKSVPQEGASRPMHNANSTPLDDF